MKTIVNGFFVSTENLGYGFETMVFKMNEKGEINYFEVDCTTSATASEAGRDHQEMVEKYKNFKVLTMDEWNHRARKGEAFTDIFKEEMYISKEVYFELMNVTMPLTQWTNGFQMAGVMGHSSIVYNSYGNQLYRTFVEWDNGLFQYIGNMPRIRSF